MTALLEETVTPSLPAPPAAATTDLMVRGDERRELLREALTLPAWSLTPRQLCDLELLMTGAFAPLTGFLDREDYDSVLESMRLSSGELWPMPITLDLAESQAANLSPGDRLTLKHPEGIPLAVLEISGIFTPDGRREAQQVFRTQDRKHPGVLALHHDTHPVRVGGRIHGLALPPHHAFTRHRHTAGEVKAELARRGWRRVVGFQTRNPLHRAHVELTRRAALRTGAKILLHPVVGQTRPGDIDAFTRVKCYEAVLPHYPPGDVMLSLLPLAMRMAGPREALWHAQIRRNFGCTHFIVGRDHAGPGLDTSGRPFYGPYEAQELVRRHAEEIGLELVEFEEMLFDPHTETYLTEKESGGRPLRRLSGTELRRRLAEGESIPSWFSYPEVIDELRARRRPKIRQGLTVFMTGLSGAGKSTVAGALVERLMELGPRTVTLLDGDLLRQNLSSELGFSRRHRDLNVQRIGFVASEITKAGGVAICAPIAPYAEARRAVRRSVSEHGGFFEVHVSTPLEVCEARDPKGLYARARSGELRGFTGIDDPYEAPRSPELSLDTSRLTTSQSVDRILGAIRAAGYLG